MDKEGNYEYQDRVIIDEIKCILGDVTHIEKPYTVHLAQAKCYAYFFGVDKEYAPEDKLVVRITYCPMKTEEKKYFHEEFSFRVLERFYNGLMDEYVNWVDFQAKWIKIRNKSAKELEFPFPYREGQKQLALDVYRTIIREKKLYLEAPTGVGKTISTTFPAIKAMGEEKLAKIFYLTARTTTATAAINSIDIMANKGLGCKSITLTAKDKMCILDKPDCNPRACVRAKGHFDRVNEAVFDLINNETRITRQIILDYAEKHKVCPFEFGLDVSIWCDVIVGDYNYAFDPNVYLRRFFQNEKKNDYLFLVDEAHNLVQRARNMYSATLVKEELLLLNSYVKAYDKKLSSLINTCNKSLLALKRQRDGMQIVPAEDIMPLVFKLMEIIARMDKLLSGEIKVDNGEEARNIYFNIRSFVNTYDKLGEDYTVYTDYNEQGDFVLNLCCMNPARLLLEYLSKGKSAVFFSATFLPIDYYKEQLAGSDEDYAVYAPSTFSTDNRLIMVANDVSTKYTRRNEAEYLKIAGYIEEFVSAKNGNYLIFFPSYKYMEDVAKYLEAYEEIMIFQKNNMSEEEREEFLAGFEDQNERLHIGMAVMGGVFSEGIDLIGDRLIGTVIVGCGLPMVCNERELFKNYYDDNGRNGFDYAYLYDGMNKVQQSVGRVIRTATDVGAILLLDERLLTDAYTR
ncbi:MAG: ATP-dependent DNA helicase, partial [Lachnospiraceae bacterium]|nr:ATP-dependent DNA helicase [Lachnospiraceae bacterium]